MTIPQYSVDEYLKLEAISNDNLKEIEYCFLGSGLDYADHL